MTIKGCFIVQYKCYLKKSLSIILLKIGIIFITVVTKCVKYCLYCSLYRACVCACFTLFEFIKLLYKCKKRCSDIFECGSLI